ncbi:MAG: hypothetical protein HY558_04790 [Euryarchaeota archaeon]|nr:hypothetical protein [Euryarchaeota archaeon]
MRPLFLVALTAAALLASLALSLAYDTRAPDVVLVDGLRLVCGDQHTHQYLSFDARVHPMDVLYTIRRQNNDFITLTDHNTALGGDLVRAWAGLLGLDTLVITGEEVTTSSWHIGALGIQTTVSRWLTLNETLDEIHRQGGIAVANHPTRKFHQNLLPAFESGKIDGLEWVNTAPYYEGKHPEVQEFIAILESRGLLDRAVKIGTSDSHFADSLGQATTCLLVPRLDRDSVLQAMRERRGAVAWQGKFQAQEPWATRLNQNPEALAKIQFGRPIPPQAAGLLFLGLMGAALFLRKVE